MREVRPSSVCSADTFSLREKEKRGPTFSLREKVSRDATDEGLVLVVSAKSEIQL